MAEAATGQARSILSDGFSRGAAATPQAPLPPGRLYSAQLVSADGNSLILTPIPPQRLDASLERFAAQLADPTARAAFARIRATSAERAGGNAAAAHRRQALAFARACGMRVHPPGTRPGFNWDGAALDGDTEAYVILHEIAHFVLAPPERRRLPDFGLGPGPDPAERDAAERAAILPPLERESDEAAASLLGILWEAEFGQPALASFLDQNWLEGLDRSAAAHFTAVLRGLSQLGLNEIAPTVADDQRSMREIR
jgi:hypothetical protein